MTLYTVWNNALPDGGTTSTSTGSRTDSLVFQVTSACTLAGIAYYVPAGETNLTGISYTALLYTTTAGTTGSLVTSQAGSGTFTPGAWNWIPISAPLTPGTFYSAAVNSPSLLQFEHNWWGAGEPGAGGRVSGPISVPDQSAAPGGVQQGFFTSGLGFPGSTNAGIGSWYGIDVQVDTGAPVMPLEQAWPFYQQQIR